MIEVGPIDYRVINRIITASVKSFMSEAVELKLTL